MKNILIAIFLTLIYTNHAMAYERHEFELNIPAKYEIEEYKSDLKNWVNSLIIGVGYKSKDITKNIFLKTSIPINVNGQKIDGAVYQNKDNPNQYYISKPKNTVIDFTSQLVGTMGVAGITSHPTPSGRMIVVLAPQKNMSILGVTLDFTVKTQVRKPVFEGNYVSYEW